MQSSGKTILIVEDDSSARDMARMALQSQNHTIVEAVNGQEGIVKFHEVNPDLVLLDVGLPEKNGFDVCRQLRQD